MAVLRRALMPALMAALAVPLPAPAALPAIKVVPVVTGLNQPVHVTHAGDGSGRLFIVERAGIVRIYAGALLPTPFVDISLLVGDVGLEQGLLSIAFHPAFATNGEVFLSYTDNLGQNVLARYRVSGDPNRLDPTSAQIILTQLQPFPNHNGGLALFGPDGYLYFGLGDGGLADDPLQNGQNPQTFLGTILRIDVDVPVAYAVPPDNPFVGDPRAADEVWAYGLRNPWRFSFDRASGDLWIADVGQGQWEEVDREPAGHPGGSNYGWVVYEGNAPYRPELQEPVTPYVFPVLQYQHTAGNCSITGGHVYRGPAIPGLRGAYLYGDYCTGRIWAGTPDGAGGYAATQLLDTTLGISSFGEDEVGEVYVAHLGLPTGGAVYRIDAA